MAHLVFPTLKPTLKKPKEPFFATARKKEKGQAEFIKC